MKTSWRRILAFSHFVGGFEANGNRYAGWLETHKEETKFNYAIRRVVDQIAALNKKMEVAFENIDIDHAATDANKVILRNQDSSIAYTQEGLKARNAARRELLDKEDIEIEPHFTIEMPGLDDAAREILIGFVIKEDREHLEIVASEAAA